PVFPGGAALRLRDLSQTGIAGLFERPVHRGRRRGRLRARAADARGGDRADRRGHRKRGLRRGPRRDAGARLRGDRVLPRRPLHPRIGKEELHLGRVQRLPGGARRALPDRVDRGRHGRERLGGLEDPQHAPGQEAAAGRRRPVRHGYTAAARGHPPGRRQLGLLPRPGGVPPPEMRLLAGILWALIVLIQYPLWLGKGGWLTAWRLESKLEIERARNLQLEGRNAALTAEVRDLKQGTE